MKLLKYPLAIVVSLLLPLINAQITVIETITVHSNSTVTVTRQPLAGATCCGPLPLCKDAITMFSPFPSFSSFTSPPPTETSSIVESSTSTLGVETPTGTPRGFLITATISGDPAVYYFSYTGLEGGVGLVPQSWGSATRWFLWKGFLRDHNPPYKFLWLNPDLSTATSKQKRDDGAVIYTLNQSYNYDEATENPLDSLRQVSSGYSVRNSVDTTVLLKSEGVSYSFATKAEGNGGVFDVIGVQSEDMEGLGEEYLPITLKAAIEALPTSSTTGGVKTTKTTGTATTTSGGTKTTTDTSSISSIDGYAGTAMDDGVLYLQTAPINLGTPAPIYLKPISPFGGIVDYSSLDTVKPAAQGKLFYGATGSTGGMILANLNVTFPHDSVYLDHSVYVVGTVCSGNTTMTVSWSGTGREAWQSAKETWKTPVVLISADVSCPRLSNDTESFLIANTLDFLDSGGLTTVAIGAFQPLEELIRSFELDVGPAAPTSVPFDYVPNIGTPNSGDTGLKFVDIGLDFDQRLNQDIGFLDGSNDDGIADILRALYPTAAVTRRKRSVGGFHVNVKRWSFSGLAKALADAAAAIAEALAKAALALLVTIFGDQSGTIGWKTFFTPDGVGRDSLNQRTEVACSSKFRKLGPWGCQVRLWMFLPKTVTTAYAQMSDQISKWGNQLVGQTTYATPGIEVYCVDCYVDLALDVKYSLKSNSTSITEASAGLKGNMTLQVQIGLNAYWEYVWNGTTSLTKIGLGPVNLGKIFQFGPYVEVEFRNDVKLALVGQLLLGFSSRWPAIDGKIDFISTEKGRSYMNGLSTPAITKIVQVYGSVTITWTIGLPVSLALGVAVDAGIFKWEKDVKFSVTPQVVVKVTFQESAAVSGRDIEFDTGLMVRGPTDLEVFERQDSSEQYCLGALLSAYSQIIVEFVFGDIATLPLFTWPAVDNPFYLFTPFCIGKMVDVPMCQKSAVASLKADLGRETFCSAIYGWTLSATTTSTVVQTETLTGSGVVTSTTTSIIGLVGNLTATHRVYTLTIYGYATTGVSTTCTGAVVAESLDSRRVEERMQTRTKTLGELPSGVEKDYLKAYETGPWRGNLGVEMTTTVEAVERAISTPAYFKGWNVASLSSACGCLLMAPPGTKVVYTTTTTPGPTSTSFFTEWISVNTTSTTANVTVTTATRSVATGIYTTLPTPLTQSFPAASYLLSTYTATATAFAGYTIPFKNYNLDINGEDLASCDCGGTGMTCNWVDSLRSNTPTFQMSSTCATLDDCSTMCTNINYLYGASNMCVGTVFYPAPRNLCVFKHKIQGLNFTDTEVPGCGVERSIAGVRVTSGIIDYASPAWTEWRYEYNYTDQAKDYQGNPLTFHRVLESSGYDLYWYFDDGTEFGINWNYTIRT
ncbi:hypothetical protein TWF506_004590 [Arthrobotrys conoides]|uniref:Apple domain-containing protein n=1 Tax=Arthrobotrys conoides TaxID=74498 RepID=A0AAN8NF03_9PEZI